MIKNYMQGIHPECGIKFEVINDIIVTPFYTEEFCDYLVATSKYFDSRFINYIRYGKKGMTNISPWQTLHMNRISSLMFEDFCGHYKRLIVPLIKKVFICSAVEGWFSPFIIKYDTIGQEVQLHNDTSSFTMNVKLNTEYEGADLHFPRQQWNNKDIPKGWCFVWPSTVTHPHTAPPLISGTKYTLASWTHPVKWSPDDNFGSIYSDDVIID